MSVTSADLSLLATCLCVTRPRWALPDLRRARRRTLGPPKRSPPFFIRIANRLRSSGSYGRHHYFAVHLICRPALAHSFAVAATSTLPHSSKFTGTLHALSVFHVRCHHRWWDGFHASVLKWSSGRWARYSLRCRGPSACPALD